MAKATEYPSSISDSAAQAFELLEGDGVNVSAFLQRIISDPEVRAKVAEIATPPVWIPMPENPSSEVVESLLRATFGWHRNWPMTETQQADFDYYMHLGFRHLTTGLNEREATVLVFRFGLDGRKPLTLEEVGAYIGRSKEAVRQIEGRALSKIRMADHKRRLEVDRQERLRSGRPMPIWELGLSERTSKCLTRAHIETVEELVLWTPDGLLAITNFGTKALGEVVAALDRIGRHLATAE